MLLGILAHGILPFTDYLLWDGWWYAADIRRNDGTPTMRRLFHEVGRPLDIVFYAPMTLVGGDPVAWAKWLGMLAWIASAICVGSVLQRVAALRRDVAMAIAALTVTLPVFDLLGELSLWMNTCCVLLFWSAWMLVGLQRRSSGFNALATRACSLCLFFLSFNLNSNLVMFYAVASALFGLRFADMKWPDFGRHMGRVARSYLDYLALPAVFWTWKSIFTPPSGFYAQGYNQPSLDPHRLLSGYAAMAIHFLAAGTSELFASSMWLGITVAVTIASTFLFWRVGPDPKADDSHRAATLTAWGSFVLAAAAFPYIVVGQNLASEGWLSRNAILCSVPLAMIVVGVLKMMTAKFASLQPWAWHTGLIVITVLAIGNCHRNYLALQAFGVKERSVQRKLAEVISEHHPCVVQLRDYFLLPGTLPYYPPAIWTFLASGTLSGPQSFVIDTRAIAPDQQVRNERGQIEVVMPQLTPTARDIDQAITQTTLPYAMEGIPRSGPQILVTIMSGSLGSQSVQLGVQYLAIKAFQPGKSQDFEDRMTEVRTMTIPPVRE